MKGIRSAANFFAAERRFAEPERDLVRNNFRRIERFLESRPLLRGFAGTRVWNLVFNLYKQSTISKNIYNI